MANYRASYSTAEKRAFADKLRRPMMEKSLTGAEVARRVGRHAQKDVQRQSVSQWLAGVSIPEEPTLRALEKVLDVPSDILLPRPHRAAPGETIVEPGEPTEARMALIPGGKMKLMLNVEVPQPIGWQILKLLEEAGH